MTDKGVEHEPRNPKLTDAFLRERQELNNGGGDAQARAFELALTPAIMGFFGYWLDRWLGTSPAFLVGLVLVTMAYLMWKFFVRYDAEMRAHEDRLFKPPAPPR